MSAVVCSLKAPRDLYSLSVAYVFPDYTPETERRYLKIAYDSVLSAEFGLIYVLVF